MDPMVYLCDQDCYLAWVEDVQMPTTCNGRRTPKIKDDLASISDPGPSLFDA